MKENLLMKNITTTLRLGGLLLSSLTSAHASLLAYDGFDGGTVFNGGTGWSAPWTSGISAGSNLTYGGLITTGVGANVGQWWGPASTRSLSTAVTSGTLWLSWVQSAGSAAPEFNQIRIQNGSDIAFVVGQHNSASTFKIYDAGFNIGANTGISIAGTHFVVMSVDLATSVVNLYIDPTGLGSGAAPSSAVSATWDGPGSISSITGLRSIGADNGSFAWDEVRVGTTWANVSPAVAVPAPAAPSALLATVNSFSEITLDWTDNSNDEFSFNVERSLNGIVWTVIGTSPADTTTFQNTGLTAATQYFYRVSASNSGGSSTYSAVVSPTTAGLPPPPAAPSALLATVDSFSEITLNWTDNSSDELSFSVERSLDGVAWVTAGTVASDEGTLGDTGLTAATQYFYRVFSTGFGGNSTFSSVASATTSALPALVPLTTVTIPFADDDGTQATSAAPPTGVTAFAGAGQIEESSALSYPGVLSSENGLTTSNGRFFMTLDTTLPGLERYMSGGRIGGSGLGVIYVSWMARGINGNEANTVEFRSGNDDNQSIVSVGTTFGPLQPNIRLITGNSLTSGAENYITTTHAASPATDFFVVKFTFGVGNTSTVDLFINQTSEGTPDASSTCFAQFNTIGFTKFGGAPNPSVDEFGSGFFSVKMLKSIGAG